MQEYSVDFEEADSGYVLTIKHVWATSGEAAIEKARKVFYYSPAWTCVGLDRVQG